MLLYKNIRKIIKIIIIKKYYKKNIIIKKKNFQTYKRKTFFVKTYNNDKLNKIRTKTNRRE